MISGLIIHGQFLHIILERCALSVLGNVLDISVPNGFGQDWSDACRSTTQRQILSNIDLGIVGVVPMQFRHGSLRAVNIEQ